MKIIQEQIRFVRSPGEFVEGLAHDRGAAYVGFRHVLTIAVLWEGAIVLWTLGDAVVTLPAFLKIPVDRYYLYQLIFMIPMFLAAWILAAGIGYLLSKPFGGAGSFDTILGGFGLTTAVSGYFALIPDYVQGILWTTGWIPFAEYQEITSHGFPAVVVWTYLLAWLFAHLALYSATIYYAARISLPKSVLVAAVAFSGSFAVWITIVR